MMSEPHPGLLGFLTEATEIKDELGIPFEAALEIQRERADGRLREYEALEQAAAESNVIPFRRKH
jgi:hypothetical protein